MRNDSKKRMDESAKKGKVGYKATETQRRKSTRLVIVKEPNRTDSSKQAEERRNENNQLTHQRF